jgi:hypothetical protein
VFSGQKFLSERFEAALGDQPEGIALRAIGETFVLPSVDRFRNKTCFPIAMTPKNDRFKAFFSTKLRMNRKIE